MRRIVRRRLNEVTYCYERQLAVKPTLQGGVDMVWVVDVSGRPTAIRVLGSTLNDHDVEACLVRRIRRWRFPKPSSGGIAFVWQRFALKTDAQGDGRNTSVEF